MKNDTSAEEMSSRGQRDKMKVVSISGKFVPWSAIVAMLLAGSGCGGSDNNAAGKDSAAQHVAVDTGSESADGQSDTVDTSDTVDGRGDTAETANTEDTQSVSDSVGTDCTDECETAGVTMCDGSVIHSCTEMEDGCNDLVAGTDCASTSDIPICDDGGDEAVCTCESECDADALPRCDAEKTGVRSCQGRANGCFYWEETICPQSLLCVLGDDGASCREPVEEVWKFVVVGDSRGWFTGVNTSVWGHLVDAIAREHPAFVLFPGDLTDDGNNSQFDRWIETTGPLYDANIGVYSVRGNHDDASLSDWNEAFSGIYAFPQNGPIGEKNLTYSFTHKNAFVAGIDNYSTSRKINQEWLDTELAKNTEPHVFVFGHEPAFAAHHQDCLDDNSSARDDFWESIAQAGGRAYFAGHDHFYDHAWVDDGDGDPDNDVHQFIVGTAGAPFYDFSGEYPGLNNHYRPVQEYFAKQYGYMVVEIDDMDVRMTFKQRSGNSYIVKDSFSYSLDLVDYCPDDPNKTKPGSCGCGVPDGTCGDPIPQRLVLTPDADAYVDGANAGKNFGGADRLLVDKAPDVYETLLRFTVPALTAELGTATLRLFVTNPSDDGPKIYLTENGWSEHGVTYNSRPGPRGGAIADMGDTQTGWLDIDVTSAIAGAGQYSFLLLPDDTNGADFDSREASNSPELVVVTGE